MHSHYRLASGLLFGAILSCGCSTTVERSHATYIVQPNVSPALETPAIATAQTLSPSSPHIVEEPQDESASPDWLHGKIQASGHCALNPKFATNPGQARLMAQRGAIVVAKRNLLERVLGLRFASPPTTVRDSITASEDMRAETTGLIRHCYVVAEHFEPATGIYTATVELPLNDVCLYLREKNVE
jgi:hypothetical protein